MKYRAVCPGCGVRFPRRFWFKWLPHVKWRCETCGCTYRVNSWWEWSTDIISGVLCASFLLLAWFHMLSWRVAVILLLGTFAVAYALFPYITPCDLVKSAPGHEDKPPA
jgi:hypothetical protein